jgi:mannose-6-phosphate isomerase-like protein (cupin superfamily)
MQRTSQTQAAVMTIEPGGDAGPVEEHSGDQIIYMVEGEALVRVQDQEYHARLGMLLTIPARIRHFVKNPGATPVFFLTVYAPPCIDGFSAARPCLGSPAVLSSVPAR